MTFFVGTSGFSYKEWKGNFYPAKIKADAMLAWYAERLGAVEINNTFYRMPRTSVIETWAGEVPPSFRFIIKASRRITHFKRLKEADEPLDFLLQATGVLEDKLGAILFQLPPNMRCDVERLGEFLALVPASTPVSFEFRHESWFIDEVFELLRGRNITICHADGEGESLPFVATADWGYLRLRQPSYSDEALAVWRQTISDSKWKDAFVFFKHEDEGAGPAMATRFINLVTNP